MTTLDLFKYDIRRVSSRYYWIWCNDYAIQISGDNLVVLRCNNDMNMYEPFSWKVF